MATLVRHNPFADRNGIEQHSLAKDDHGQTDSTIAVDTTPRTVELPLQLVLVNQARKNRERRCIVG